MTTGRILHLQRFSTEDGPGIRTTVFFKGCPLRCEWCHNPESLESRPQTQWHATRCLGCHACLDACPNGALAATGAGMVIDRTRCKGCGTCADACPAGALELLGRDVTAEQLLPELLRDRAYFRASGGGITLSGGEPTLQPDLAEALLRGLRERGVATALDTCGFCPADVLARLLPHVDLLLYDLKLLDEELHRRFTGRANTQILDNAGSLPARLRELGRPVVLWIRTPLIPGATAMPENLSALGRWIAERLGGAVARWELCAFNNLCRDQYARLGAEWVHAKTPLLTADELAACERVAREAVGASGIVVATGATRTPASS